tara:strand:- start:267 stop:899 length:633 start_codon:yes stop_codon:yes gene_type:complete
MINFTLTIDGKKKTINSPSAWNELTLYQFIRIENEFMKDKENFILLFNILTGLDIEFLEGSKDKEVEKQLYRICAFICEPIELDNVTHSDALLINGDAVMIPKDLSDITLGQKIMVSQAIKNIDDIVTKIPIVLANIMQPAKDGKYDRHKVKELEVIINDCNGLECYSLAKGFFLRSKILNNIGLTNSKAYQSQRMRQRNISPKWLTEIG